MKTKNAPARGAPASRPEHVSSEISKSFADPQTTGLAGALAVLCAELRRPGVSRDDRVRLRLAIAVLRPEPMTLKAAAAATGLHPETLRRRLVGVPGARRGGRYAIEPGALAALIDGGPR